MSVTIEGNMFSECAPGTFGVGCLTCNCQGDCDRIDGSCSTQCEPGWMGHDCQIGRNSIVSSYRFDYFFPIEICEP